MITDDRSRFRGIQFFLMNNCPRCSWEDTLTASIAFDWHTLTNATFREPILPMILGKDAD